MERDNQMPLIKNIPVGSTFLHSPKLSRNQSLSTLTNSSQRGSNQGNKSPLVSRSPQTPRTPRSPRSPQLKGNLQETEIKASEMIYESELQHVACPKPTFLFNVLKNIESESNAKNSAEIISVVFEDRKCDYVNKLMSLQKSDVRCGEITYLSNIYFDKSNAIVKDVYNAENCKLRNFIVLKSSNITEPILDTVFEFVILMRYNTIIFDQIDSIAIIEKIISFAKIYKKTYKTLTICYPSSLDVKETFDNVAVNAAVDQHRRRGKGTNCLKTKAKASSASSCTIM